MSQQCKAKSKQSGERCKRWASRGFEVCYMHGASSGAPKGNRNAVSHGFYETLLRERLPEEEQVAFDAIPVDAELTGELRVLRFKLLRLLGEVEQNMVAGFNIQRIKADDLVKVDGIVKLSDAIRKIVKEMQGAGQDDPLAALVRDWEEGMRSEGKLETRPQPETK